MVTLTDVALVAGVSATTVSHVINGTRYVSAATIERVQRAIADTGYSGNPFARALRTSTTETIGFVASITNPYSTAVLAGVSESLRDVRHTLLVADSGGGTSVERDEVDALAHRLVDGLIVAMTPNSGADMGEYLAHLPIPVVLIDQASPARLDQVLVENVRSVASVVGEMIDCGHRRVAILCGPQGHSTTLERVQGWRLAHDERGLVADDTLIVDVGVTVHDIEAAVSGLLDLADRPTALFSASNTVTLGALRATHRAGLRIPDDLSFAAFDDVEWADLLAAPISCLAQPTARIGHEAVSLLFRRIGDREAEPKVVRLDPEFRSRGSCAAPPTFGA